jgi:hypothetical protein
MISFVYLRNAASRSLLSEHLEPGYHFHEAFSVSEAVWLCTQKHLGTIVIAENLECSEVSEIENCYATFCLDPHITVNELLCHLTAA